MRPFVYFIVVLYNIPFKHFKRYFFTNMFNIIKIYDYYLFIKSMFNSSGFYLKFDVFDEQFNL